MFPGRNEGKAGKKVEPISQFLVPKTSGDEKKHHFPSVFELRSQKPNEKV